MIPIWWKAWKVYSKKRKEEKAKAAAKKERLKKLNEADKIKAANLKAEKKAARKLEKEKKKKEPSKWIGIWKDILLLLILLLLLFAIGAYFYNYQPLGSSLNGTDNTSNQSGDINITEDDGLLNGVSDESVQEEEETEVNVSEDVAQDEETIVEEEPTILLDSEVPIEHPADKDIVCDLTLVNLTEKQKEDIEIDSYQILYSWYLDRTGDGVYEQIYYNQSSNRVLAYEIAVGDLWKCEVLLENEFQELTVNSSPYSIVDPIVKVNEMIAYIEDNNLSDSFNYLIIESGETVEVDLSDYFIDPDGDQLFFSADIGGTRGVEVDIWKGIATIQAASDYVGVVDVKFSAEDPDGEGVDTDMTIVVKPKEEENKFMQFLREYGIYIILVILMVLLVFGAIVLYRMIMNDKGGKKNEAKPPEEFFKTY